MKVLAIITALALVLAGVLGGAAPFGRLMLAAGVPMAGLFKDDGWRGIAAYRAGDFDAAALAFNAAGDDFNLGNAEVQRGKYAAALEAYDNAIQRGDADAQANFDLLSLFYAGLALDPDAIILAKQRDEGPKKDSFVARGNARAVGTGSEATNTMLGLAELDSRGRLGIRRIFDDKFMVADKRWLAQLEDVPGAYLAARILQEHKRRDKLGLSPPDPEDPR